MLNMTFLHFRTILLAIFTLYLTLFAMSSATAQTFTPLTLLTYRDILDRKDRPTPTHVIKYGTNTNQVGELWLPDKAATLKKAATTKHPVVMLLHGGCWRQDLPGPELVAFLADALRLNGVAVWSVSYRRIGLVSSDAEKFSPYPDTFLDVAAAADKLRELSATYPLDIDRVVATGHSAGGHLAMWLAARHKLPAESALYDKNPLPIFASVGIAAMPDLNYASKASAHACGVDTIDLLVDTKSRGVNAYRDTSITSLLPLGVKQTLISATYDAIVAPAQAHRHLHAQKMKRLRYSRSTMRGISS
jgi:acetyl esterase/lipase